MALQFGSFKWILRENFSNSAFISIPTQLVSMFKKTLWDCYQENQKKKTEKSIQLRYFILKPISDDTDRLFIYLNK